MIDVATSQENSPVASLGNLDATALLLRLAVRTVINGSVFSNSPGFFFLFLFFNKNGFPLEKQKTEL